MNIKKFSKRLSKINRLFDGIKEDGEVSAIEKDLLLSYLREAYEYVQNTDEDESKTVPSPKRTYKEPETHVPPTPVAKNVIETITSAEIVAPKVEPITAPQPVAANIPVQREVVQEVVTTSTAVFSNLEINPVLQEIFDADMGSDLSDRLSMSPIKDMNKSMGINERIFTVKELFGNDNELFTSIMDRINQLSSYDEAKNYLATGIAKDQDWANDAKINKAEKFIKLVKRRFA